MKYTDSEQTAFMKQYLCPKCKVSKLLLGSASILIGLLGLSDGLPPTLLPVFLAVGFFQIWLAVKSQVQFYSILNHLRKNCAFDSVLRDFSDALPVYENKIRFGNHYLFARSRGFIIPYCEISQVYPYVHTINHIEVDRELRLKDLDEKEYTLCALELEGKSDAQMMHIIQQLQEKNPSISIGYSS